jgi:hypothetical protein
MKREEVRALIESAIHETNPSYRFNSGRITEFNSNRSNEYPYLWMESLSRETDIDDQQRPFDNWNCVIHIANLDQPGTPAEVYEPIIDECDLIAKRFTYRLNQVVSGYKLIFISTVTCEPFIHKQADNTSGVILSFTLSMIDQTDVC